MGLYALAFSGVGLAVAAVAGAWPYLPKRIKTAPEGLDRADWVNRLFVLAAQADADGSASVAAAARQLIASLVEKPKK